MIRGEELTNLVKTAIQSKMPHALEQVADIRIPRLSDVRVPEGARARIEFGGDLAVSWKCSHENHH